MFVGVCLFSCGRHKVSCNNFLKNRVENLGLSKVIFSGVWTLVAVHRQDVWLFSPCVRALVRLFCDPVDCSPSCFSVYGVFQARILEWVAISSSRGSSWPRDQTHVSYIGRWVLYRSSTWVAHFSSLSTAVSLTPCCLLKSALYYLGIGAYLSMW